MASISCRHVKKVYPGNVTAVPDFSLEIADKEFIVFVGHRLHLHGILIGAR